MKTSRFLLPRVGLLALILQSGFMFAANQANPSPSNTRTTLYVVVKDRSGNPVTGLGEQAFAVLVNKQPQKIVAFDAVGNTSNQTVPVEAVIVLDAVNVDFRVVAYLQQEVKKFLQRDEGRLSIPTSLAFFSDSGLTTPGDTSLDGNSLVQVVNQHNPGLRESRRSQGFYGAAERAQLSLRSLGGLAESLENKPGRKVVIWISPGWALLSGPNVQLSTKDEQQIFNTVVGLSTQLIKSSITLYSVDPLGTADAASMRTFYYQQFLKPVRKPNQTLFGNLALQVFATHSGGRVLNSSNDLSAEIEAAYRDAKSYYAISFDAPPADGPNDYQAIEVKVNQPDVKTQTLTGLYADPTPVAGR